MMDAWRRSAQPGSRRSKSVRLPPTSPRRQEIKHANPIGDPLPLDRIAEAHDRVEVGARERVLLAIPS